MELKSSKQEAYCNSKFYLSTVFPTDVQNNNFQKGNIKFLCIIIKYFEMFGIVTWKKIFSLKHRECLQIDWSLNNFLTQENNTLLLINLAQHKTPPPPAWGRGSKHITLLAFIYFTVNIWQILITRWLLFSCVIEDQLCFTVMNILFYFCRYFICMYIVPVWMNIYWKWGGGAYMCIFPQ
jgi:hypothetical protein